MKQIEKYDIYKSNVKKDVVTDFEYLGKAKSLGDLVSKLPKEFTTCEWELVLDDAWIYLRVCNQIDQYVVALKEYTK